MKMNNESESEEKERLIQKNLDDMSPIIPEGASEEAKAEIDIMRQMMAEQTGLNQMSIEELRERLT